MSIPIAEQCRKDHQFQMSFGKMGSHILLLEGVKLLDAREGRLGRTVWLWGNVQVIYSGYTEGRQSVADASLCPRAWQSLDRRSACYCVHMVCGEGTDQWNISSKEVSESPRMHRRHRLTVARWDVGQGNVCKVQVGGSSSKWVNINVRLCASGHVESHWGCKQNGLFQMIHMGKRKSDTGSMISWNLYLCAYICLWE